jgi:hypothetical protein
MAKDVIETVMGAFSTTINLNEGVVLVTPSQQIKKTKAPIPEVDKLGDIASWGSNNNFPKEVIDTIKKNDLILAVRERKIEMVYSGGVRYGYYEATNTEGNDSEKKARKLVELQIPEIDEFLDNTAIDAYCHDALSDHFTFANFYPRLRKNLKGDKIARLEVSDAVHTRLSLQDKNGDILKAYVNANYHLGRGVDSDDTLKIDALNPYFNVVEQLMDPKKSDFIAPMRHQRDGNVYYALASWDGVRTIGWLDVAYFVPQLKKFLLQNVMKTKVLITVDQLYWPTVYSDWNNMDTKAKEEARQDLIDTVVSTTSSTDKAGGTLTLPKVWDKEKGIYKELVEVKALDLNFDSIGKNEDSQEAETHIYRAWGMQASLAGMPPGGGHNAGSGSDLRVGRNNFTLDNKIHADWVLKPLKWIAEFNGWSKRHGNGNKIFFYFENHMITTLDKGTETKELKEPGNGNS